MELLFINIRIHIYIYIYIYAITYRLRLIDIITYMLLHLYYYIYFLFKKGKLDDINNYRPISLLSQFSKILEKIIYNRFLHFIDKHNLLYAKQYGFIRNSSTSHAL